MSVYGGGETPGRLLLNNRKFVLWPTDNNDYNEKSDRCYQAHPYVLALRKDGSAFGVIFDTTFRLEMDFNNQISAASEKPFSVIIFEGNNPQ